MEVTRADADEYITELKQKLNDQPENYPQFFRALEQFVQRKIDYRTLMLTVVPLIKGHPDLVLGLQKFLPRDCTFIDSVIPCKKEVPNSKDAVDLTLSLAGDLEGMEKSADEQIDLTLSLAGSLQWRRNSSRKQDQLPANRAGNGGEASMLDLSLRIGGVKVEDASNLSG